MRRTTLSVFALAAAGLAAPVLAQDQQAPGQSYCNTGSYAFDRDGDAMLTEEEIETGSRAVFDEMDADTDGAITRDEYAKCAQRALEAAQEAFSRSYGDLDAASLEEAWATAAEDAPGIDEDGMSRADFLAAAMAAGELMPTMTLEAAGAEPVAFGGPFIHFDAEESPEEMSAEEIAARSAHTFELTDTDGDDRISREEFVARGDDLTPTAEQINRRFDTMDTDRDASLTPDEFSGLDRLRTADGPDPAEGVPVIFYFFYQRG